MSGIEDRDVFPFSFEWNADASRLYVAFWPIPARTAFANAFPGHNYNSGTAGAYYLERGSDTWTRITLPPGVYAVSRFGCDPVSPDVVYFAARHRGGDQQPTNGGIYVSKDAGKTWRLLTATNMYSTSVAVSTFDPDRIYFGESSFFFNGGMVYYSDKGPDTQVSDWKPINFDFQYVRVNNVQQDPRTPNAVYVSTHGASVWHLIVEKRFVAHTVLNATYTSTLTLADFNEQLSDGYAWVNPSTRLMAGNNQQFRAIYTDPSGNNESVIGFITVNVTKAADGFTALRASHLTNDTFCVIVGDGHPVTARNVYDIQQYIFLEGVSL
jgi:hypothetical protein